MSDPFKEFVEEMARLAVPEDDTEESRARREAAASELGTPISELDESTSSPAPTTSSCARRPWRSGR
jgi:hypothetical protein